MIVELDMYPYPSWEKNKIYSGLNFSRWDRALSFESLYALSSVLFCATSNNKAKDVSALLLYWFLANTFGYLVLMWKKDNYKVVVSLSYYSSRKAYY